MAWFKVDDKLWGHPKWLAVPPKSRALWVTAGSWCAANETDGKVPSHVLTVLGGNARDAAALVEAGLWKERAAGWIFHEWGVYQPDAASLKAKRQAGSESGSIGNHRRWHVKRNIRVPGCDWCDGVPPEDEEPPLTEDQIASGYPIATRIGGESGSGDSGANPPVPIPIPDKDQVGGGGHLSSDEQRDPPPPPTSEILDAMAESWRCPNHQGIDTPCNHCKRYKAAWKALEAERAKAAKNTQRAIERERTERERRERTRPLTPEEQAAVEEAKAKALNAVKEAL